LFNSIIEWHIQNNKNICFKLWKNRVKELSGVDYFSSVFLLTNVAHSMLWCLQECKQSMNVVSSFRSSSVRHGGCEERITAYGYRR